MKHTLFTMALTWLIIPTITGQVWTENFDGDWTQNWYASAGVWEVGAPTTGPNAAFSGEGCLATLLAGNYPDGANSRFTRYTPFVVPSDTLNPRLRFWHWFATHGGDVGRVQISTLTGPWVDLTEYTYSGSCSNVWSVEEVDLGPWADSTVLIAFQFTAGNSIAGNPPGWYIDSLDLRTGPYTHNHPEDFEQGYGDWSVDRGTWQIGALTPGVGPAGCHSGTQCAGTVLSGTYADGISTQLRSTWLTLATDAPGLRFFHWYSTHGSDHGSIWLRTPTTPWVEISPQWSGSSPVWSFYYLDLSAFAGSTVQLAFRFTSVSSIAGNPVGWYIDDIDIDLEEITIGLDDQLSGSSVLRAFPNPFSGTLSMKFPPTGSEQILISNSHGRSVRVIDHLEHKTVEWDGRNASGAEVPSGVYFVTVITDGQRYTQRVIKQ